LLSLECIILQYPGVTEIDDSINDIQKLVALCEKINERHNKHVKLRKKFIKKLKETEQKKREKEFNSICIFCIY